MSAVEVHAGPDRTGRLAGGTVITDRAWVHEALSVRRSAPAPFVVADLGGPAEPTLPEIAAGTVVVALSVVGADTAPFGYAALVGEREHRLRTCHPCAVVLRCAPVVEELAIYASPAGRPHGVFHAHPAEPAPWVAADDVADVVLAVVSSGSDRAGMTYDLTGEDLVTAHELMEAMGVPVSNMVPGDDLCAALIAAGHPAGLVRFVVDQQLWTGTEIPVSPTVRRSLGRRPIGPVAAARALVAPRWRR